MFPFPIHHHASQGDLGDAPLGPVPVRREELKFVGLESEATVILYGLLEGVEGHGGLHGWSH